MNGVQLTNHLTAQFMASTISRYEAEIREDGDFRGRRARSNSSNLHCSSNDPQYQIKRNPPPK